MSYYNHFSKKKYKEIEFGKLNISDKLRKDFFNGKKRRTDIICIKISKTEYQELKSKKIHSFYSVDAANTALVSDFKEQS